MTNVETVWFILFGTWDDKKVLDELVQKNKTIFGMDFKNYHKHGFVLTLLNSAVRKIRKWCLKVWTLCVKWRYKNPLKTHKIEVKLHYGKRKKIKCKEDFKKHRNGNAVKKLCNKFCDNDNHSDLKVELEEVDLSQKEEPEWKLL